MKVKTTFRGTKTLLVASTERKYNWKGVTCYSSLLPQNKKEKQPICHCVAFVTYHTNHQQPKYISQWGKGVFSQISPAIPSLTSKYLREIIYLAWHCTAMIRQHMTIIHPVISNTFSLFGDVMRKAKHLRFSINHPTVNGENRIPANGNI